ncbi:hypothetical protein PV326_005009 [Microctonus aethiopoides]|nr:hypothetical protein PV326_005009 [Microctonus aethiopoides]
MFTYGSSWYQEGEEKAVVDVEFQANLGVAQCSSNHETMALAGFHWPISGLRLARNRRAILHNWYFVYTGSQGFRPYQGCGSTSRAPRPSSLSRAESGRRRLDRNGIGYI